MLLYTLLLCLRLLALASGLYQTPHTPEQSVHPQDEDNEWMYDAAGWVILGVVAFGWVALARAQMK
jgi:hypothetical protein